jgi:protein-disulfide isomerase
MIPGGQAPAEDEAVTVHLVTDFLCPWCGRFEKNQASALSDMARAGEIRLVVHPVAYLSGWNDEYSLRALTAVATVAYLQPEKYMDFSAALWEAQPGESENGEDLTDERIRQIAIDAGVTNAVANTLTIGGSPVAEWADWASEQGLDMIEGTPTIFMSYAGSEPAQWKGWLIRTTDSNGNEVMLRGDLAKAVANVKAGKDPSGG